MATAQWIKKLGAHAGELYVAAELSKRAIPNALLPENFSDSDLLIGNKDGSKIGYVQVKSFHPKRANSFLLTAEAEKWVAAPDSSFAVLVRLGSPDANEAPSYWIAKKREVGKACVDHPAHGTDNWERRFGPGSLPESWKDNWAIFSDYMP